MRRRWSGFTLLEVMIASLLAGFLMLMTAGVWSTLARSTAGNIAEGEIATEARMALETLRRDASGTLPGASAGGRQRGRLVGRLIVGGRELRLCYDGDSANGVADWADPDRVVVYALAGDRLTRTQLGTAGELVVADHAEQFVVTDVGSGVRMALTLRRRDALRTFTFVIQDP
jgi:prepilin-type N-terminal cleavage/methylation domain-containing protein